MELPTGLGLATVAGLNAYIPLLALGLLARFTDLVALPQPWAALVFLAILVPVLVLVAAVALVWAALTLISRRRRTRTGAQ